MSKDNRASKSLLELMNDRLIDMTMTDDEKFNDLRKFITKDELSAEFIRNVLHDPTYIVPIEDSDDYSFSKARARHSVITFFMGMIIFSFEYRGKELTEKIADDLGIDKDKVIQIWMAVSLYHDKGYYSDVIKKPENEIDYEKMTRYYLLTDHYDSVSEENKTANDFEELSVLNDYYHKFRIAFAHTYEQIILYDKYARKFHKRIHDDEHVDHGILGGILVFDDLVKRRKKGKSVLDLISIKLVSLTIAQHNIFKSDSKDMDKEYGDKLSHLWHDSDSKIGLDTPFLFLLSLVDTIECVKKFSREKSKKAYLETLTVLSSIKITIEREKIIFDFTELHQKIRDKNHELTDLFEHHLKTVRGLDHWTKWHADITDDRVVISVAD